MLAVLAYFITAILILALWTIGLRMIFRINRQVSNQEAIIQLLLKQARVQGVNPLDLDAIRNFYGILELGSDTQAPPEDPIGVNR